MKDEKERELGEAQRSRSNTNESNISSGADSTGKKPGKLKLLKAKLKSSSSFKLKEDPISPKDQKEKKRRGSAFALLMKRGKDGNKREAEEEYQQEKAMDETCSTEELNTFSSQTESVVATPSADYDTTQNSTKYQPTHKSENESLQAQVDRFLKSGVGNDAVVSNSSTESELNTTQITLVNEPENLPPIPEKTRMRAHSPNHDVPRNNRPVTEIVSNEDNTDIKVDGYITEEQIDALLKSRKDSNSGMHLLTVPSVAADTSPLSTSPTPDGWGEKRPSFVSCSSVESEESAPSRNSLLLQRRSSSTGSFKGYKKFLDTDTDLTQSESSDSLSLEGEGNSEPQRRAPRATDAITANYRISLTFPEFIVKEEEGPSSPETPKGKKHKGQEEQEEDNDDSEEDNDDGEDNDDDEYDDGEEGNDGGEEDNDDGEEDNQEDNDEGEDEETGDFFPVIGGVRLRPSASLQTPAGDRSKNELRTSGIIGLKEYLKTHEDEDMEEIKSGISRLGHSAAIEKLKQSSSES